MLLLVDTVNNLKAGYKLQLQLRLSGQDKLVADVQRQAHAIVSKISSKTFVKNLLFALNETSYHTEILDYSRYGWMVESDVSIGEVMANPIGYSNRDIDPFLDGMISDENEDLSDSPSAREYLFYWTILAFMLLCITLMILHLRLRTLHAALQKDKQFQATSSLREMWNRFQARRKMKRTMRQHRREQELGLLVHSDDDLNLENS